MKDYMKLATGRQIEVEDGTYLGGIVHIAETEAAAMEVCAAITPEALAHVEFCPGETDEAYGIYDDLTLNAAPTRQTNEDETVTVTISLREKSDIEKRVDALEESQAVHLISWRVNYGKVLWIEDQESGDQPEDRRGMDYRRCAEVMAQCYCGMVGSELNGGNYVRGSRFPL